MFPLALSVEIAKIKCKIPGNSAMNFIRVIFLNNILLILQISMILLYITLHIYYRHVHDTQYYSVGFILDENIEMEIFCIIFDGKVQIFKPFNTSHNSIFYISILVFIFRNFQFFYYLFLSLYLEGKHISTMM